MGQNVSSQIQAVLPPEEPNIPLKFGFVFGGLGFVS